MKRLSIDKIRGLQRIANTDGVFARCAMDYRGSLRSMIDEVGTKNIKIRGVL